MAVGICKQKHKKLSQKSRAKRTKRTVSSPNLVAEKENKKMKLTQSVEIDIDTDIDSFASATDGPFCISESNSELRGSAESTTADLQNESECSIASESAVHASVCTPQIGFSYMYSQGLALSPNPSQHSLNNPHSMQSTQSIFNIAVMTSLNMIVFRSLLLIR